MKLVYRDNDNDEDGDEDDDDDERTEIFNASLWQLQWWWRWRWEHWQFLLPRSENRADGEWENMAPILLPDKQSAPVMIIIMNKFTIIMIKQFPNRKILGESLSLFKEVTFFPMVKNHSCLIILSIHLFSNLSRFYFLTESPFQWVKIICVIIDPFSSNLSHFYFFRCVFSSSISETNFLSLLIHLSSYLSHFQFFNW